MNDTYELKAVTVESLLGGVKVISPHGSKLTIEFGLSQLVAVEEIQPSKEQDPQFTRLFEAVGELAERALRQADVIAERAVQYELELPRPEEVEVEMPFFLRRYAN